MRKISQLLLLVTLPFIGTSQNLVPKPVKAEVREGIYSFFPAVTVYCQKDLEQLAYYLAGAVDNVQSGRAASLVVIRAGHETAPGINLYIDESMPLPAEGYRLSVTPQQVVITGKDYGGVFNGIQTLFQLMPPDIYRGTAHDAAIYSGGGSARLAAPCMEIEDYPRFPYRGMHLDVARTFSTKEDVLKFIEALSYHKINKFHWHLTDDEGWRIEIKSRPELARIGGFRGRDSPVMAIYGKWDEKYGGYFTHEDIREVVAFAALRNIEIIPEIDLPGHSRTAALVYPEILCTGYYNSDPSAGYDRRDVWCASKESNYEILDDILREVCELFPSRYIHVGGDEVDFTQWNACPGCQALKTEKGLADGHAIEGYFMSRLEQILAKYGKVPAVWNEAVKGGLLSKDVRVHGWEDVKVCRDAAAHGYRTIVMPGKYFYYDMKHTPQEPGMAWAGTVDTPVVYSFDFTKQGFTAEEMMNVEGVQGAFWAELYLSNIETFNGMGYLWRQTYPRVCALSEIAWMPQEQREWTDFESRMEGAHYARLDAIDVPYRVAPEPAVDRPMMRPAMKFTSSMSMLGRNPASNVAEYKYGSQARTTRTCKTDDWLQFDFERPVECSSMNFTTGYSYLPRCLVNFGYAEVLYDGEEAFERYADLYNGKVSVRPGERKIKSVRIVSTSERNGESSVIIQPVKIYR